MAKIIIFGDINIAPLYIRVDGSKEMVITGKWARCINVSEGTHYIEATTEPKFSRATRGSLVADAIMDATNTNLAGNINLNSDDVLLFQVKQTVTKSNVYHKIVDISEVNKYVNMKNVLDYKEKAPGEKNKWITFFLCLFFGCFGVHRFYERKFVTGTLYLLTLGFFGIGVIYDLVHILYR